MVNNFTIINKTTNHLPPQIIEKERWFKFSHCEHSICMYQLSLSTCMYEVHNSKVTRYSEACFRPGFFDWGLLLKINLQSQRFLVITSKCLRSSLWPC